jgi:hypothetical protein
VKFHSLRRSLAGGVFAFITAALVAACGGGGAAQSTQGGAVVSILPATGSIYAGVPYTFTITGGRAPYTLSSSEPQLLRVPTTLTGNNNTFTVVAANPGVIDVGLDPNAVPSRSVTITVRDSATSTPITGTYNVLQNFLTAYGVSFTPVSCTSSTPSTAPTSGLSVPGGCEIGVQFNATTNGNRFGDRPYRIEVIRGPAFLIDPTTGASGATVTVRSDHQGVVHAIMRTIAGAPTQLAVIRVVDVATGAYTDTVFTISGGNSTTALTAIPNTFTFTGPDNATCGTGEADVFVFDGTAPYAAASSNPNLVVFPIDANNTPGIFRIRAVNPNVCVTNATVVFTDRFGARTTATVTTSPGANPPPAPPAPPVSVSPTTLTLGCGQSASVSVTGGTPPYGASSPTPGVTAAVVANTLTVNRAATGNTGAGGTSTTTQVSVTDGATIATVSVTVPTVCP